MEESGPSLGRLLEEISKRADHSSIITSNDALPQEIHDITCDNLLLEHGSNYIRDLTGLTEAHSSEIFDVCKETINYDGPGHRYSDLKRRLPMYWFSNSNLNNETPNLNKMKQNLLLFTFAEISSHHPRVYL